MQYVESELTEFQRDFAKRRTRQLIALIPVAAAFALLIASDRGRSPAFGLDSDTTGFVFFGIIACVLIFSFLNWRCPACNSYLGKRINPSFCSSCGVALRSRATSIQPRSRA